MMACPDCPTAYGVGGESRPPFRPIGGEEHRAYRRPFPVIELTLLGAAVAICAAFVGGFI